MNDEYLNKRFQKNVVSFFALKTRSRYLEKHVNQYMILLRNTTY